MKNVIEGWKYLVNSSKFHYFVNGRSLCNRWATLSDFGLKQDEFPSPDDCKVCRKKLDKRKEHEAVA